MLEPTVREAILGRVSDDVAFVDLAVEEARTSVDGSVSEELIVQARDRVCSVRLTAHLVAALVGEEDPLTTLLRGLHVQLSDLIQ